jgi:hypothetical protein
MEVLFFSATPRRGQLASAPLPTAGRAHAQSPATASGLPANVAAAPCFTRPRHRRRGPGSAALASQLAPPRVQQGTRAGSARMPTVGAEPLFRAWALTGALKPRGCGCRCCDPRLATWPTEAETGYGGGATAAADAAVRRVQAGGRMRARAAPEKGRHD